MGHGTGDLAFGGRGHGNPTGIGGVVPSRYDFNTILTIFYLEKGASYLVPGADFLDLQGVVNLQFSSSGDWIHSALRSSNFAASLPMGFVTE